MERDEIARIQDSDEIFLGMLKDEKNRTGIESPLSDSEVAGAALRAAWRQLIIIPASELNKGLLQ